MRRFRNVLILLLSATAFFSCKDDDPKDYEAKYLSGSLKFSIPPYIESGSTYTMLASGVTHPENKDMGCYWKITPGMERNDTTKRENSQGTMSYTFTFKEELTTYTVACGIFASGYTSSSRTATVLTVDGGIDKSITFKTPAGAKESLSDGGNSFIDNRDARTYYTQEIGPVIWMRQNLAYAEDRPEGTKNVGVPYMDAEAMTDVFGLYYTYEQAKNICPAGWRLPKEKDIMELAKTISPDGEFTEYNTLPGVSGAIMADGYFNGERMWEYWPTVTITNSQKLFFFPTGYVMIPPKGNNIFGGVMEYAGFWLDETDKNEPSTGLYRYMYVDQPDLFIGKGSETFALPVRCVKDKQ